MQSEQNSRLYIYYLITAAIFLLLKLFHSEADTKDLLFLIAPVAKFIEFATGSTAVYLTDNGYYFESLNIIIDKSCSGFNFGCLCFLILSFLAFKYIYGGRKRLLIVPTTLLCSYVATLFVNTSRIMLALLLNRQTATTNIHSPRWLHLAEGIFVYLFFLILIYLLADYTLSKLKQRQHEKSA